MVVPSHAEGATERDVNLVFWNWGRGSEARLEVVDDDDCLRGAETQEADAMYGPMTWPQGVRR